MSKQAFIKSVLGKQFKVIDTAAVDKTDDVIFKVTLQTGNCADHYDRLKLTVIGKSQQKVIDTQCFIFDDYLAVKPDSRTHNKFEVIGYCGWHWYIQQPTQSSINHMINEIKSYMELYK